MEGIFVIIFKKVVDLLSEPLKPLLLKRRDRFLEALLDLHLQLKKLDDAISVLAERLDWVLKDLKTHTLSYHVVNEALHEIRTILLAIRADAASLSPGLEIYAEQILKSIAELTQIEDFYVNRSIPNDLVNLAAPMGSREQDEVVWRPVLTQVRDQARETSMRIREFIRANYTLETFRSLTS